MCPIYYKGSCLRLPENIPKAKDLQVISPAGLSLIVDSPMIMVSHDAIHQYLPMLTGMLSKICMMAEASAGGTPQPRYLYSMDTYFSQNKSTAGDKFVVFGGAAKNKCYLNDLWEFDISNSAWHQKSKIEPEPGKACRYMDTR